MSLLLQIALGALVLGGVGFGVWNAKQDDRVPTDQPRTVQTNETKQNINTDTRASLRLGITDADLEVDIKAIDNELKAVSNSSLEVDQSINSKTIVENR